MEEFTNAENIPIPDSYFKRIKTGIASLDFLFGDGLLPGSTITLDAKQGTGKTQFCLQLLTALQNKGYLVGYASNEESKEQLAFTCKRIGTNKIPIANIANPSDIVRAIHWHEILVVDSFSMIDLDEYNISTRAAEKKCIKDITDAAHESGCCVIIIMHHTKMGQMKGSSLIPHKVDANLHIKKDEVETDIREVFYSKNRFGPLNSISLRLTSCGYDFELLNQGIYNGGDPNDAPKKTMKEDCKKILNMPIITVESVMEAYDYDNLKAVRYLKELCLQGLLYKIGRGETAEYSKV